MIKIFNMHSLYKLIVIIFLIVAIIKMRAQFVTLHLYNTEIASLNNEIEILKNNIDHNDYNNTREEIEDIARKDLRMYYPNETPYKGH